MINFLRKMFSSKQLTEEHFPDYKCKGICHDCMRCVDLPNHAEICTAKELILTPETNHCKAPLPDSIYQSYRDTVMEHDGKACQVYEERKECEE